MNVMTNAWKVQLNDSDYSVVLAETEGVAVSLAIRDAYRFSGVPADELIEDDGILGIKRRQDLDGANLTVRQLIRSFDCVPNNDLSDEDLDELHGCIFLSTEL